MTRILNAANKRRNRKGFTLVELTVVMIIIVILSGLGLAAYTTTTDKARMTAVSSDMKGFETSFKQCILENPQFAKKTGDDDVQFQTIVNKLNVLLEAEMKIDLAHSGDSAAFVDGTGTLTEVIGLKQADYIGTYRQDPWGTRYRIFINQDELDIETEDGTTTITKSATGIKQSDLRIMLVSSGKNAESGDSASTIDTVDDVILCVEVVNGQIRSGFYGMKDTAATNKLAINADGNDLLLAALPELTAPEAPPAP